MPTEPDEVAFSALAAPGGALSLPVAPGKHGGPANFVKISPQISLGGCRQFHDPTFAVFDCGTRLDVPESLRTLAWFDTKACWQHPFTPVLAIACALGVMV